MTTPLYPENLPLSPRDNIRPPGMVAAEIPIWRAFKQTNLSQLTAVHYNVHVGTIAGDDPNQPDDERLLRATLAAKRVDVIARLTCETWVIEVKERATPRAIGQLLTYIPLVARRFPDFPALRPILLAMTIDPDAAAICDTLGITCVIPPFSRLTPIPRAP